MAERVSTGGNVSFEYRKGQSPKLSEKQKNEIDEAYGKYYERKSKEKKRRAIAITVGAIIILLIILGLAIS